jgi:PleD family two-component response regulator
LHAADCRPEATLIAADAALYVAKGDGRDCVRLAGDGNEAARQLLGIA